MASKQCKHQWTFIKHRQAYIYDSLNYSQPETILWACSLCDSTKLTEVKDME